MAIDVWGLKTCDTCREALSWLRSSDLPHRFRDVRSEGVTPEAMQDWIRELGWEALVNTRGTTWRGLPEAERADLDADRACRLMLAHPAVMKRPVFDLGVRRLVGFGEDQRKVMLQANPF